MSSSGSLPLDYGYPAGSSITKREGSSSSFALSAGELQEQQNSEGLIAVFAGVAVVLLACVALGCSIRRGCPHLGRSPALEGSTRGADVEAGTDVPERHAEIKEAPATGGAPGDGAEGGPPAAEEDPYGGAAAEDGPLPSKDFWFLPVDEFVRIPADRPLPRHQELRDAGLLVKRSMAVEEVMSGRFAADTAAVSHRWPTPEHFDPKCTKIAKLREILTSTPSIKFLWIDWACAPQCHGGGRTDEEEEEFGLILENILPFIFLGCSVIVLYERIYNQRFWPNVECWIATKMPTEDGLVPASEDRLRVQVYGIDSASGQDEVNLAYVLEMWHAADAQQAVHDLSKNDILVTNARDKEVNLKVVASLDSKIRSHYVSHI